MVLTAFANDSGFVASLDKACGKFINNNSVTKKANASTKSPGKMNIESRDELLLCRWCTHSLRLYKIKFSFCRIACQILWSFAEEK